MQYDQSTQVVKNAAVPVELARNLARIWIKQQLRGIAAQSGIGIPGAVNAKPVTLANTAAWYIAMPDIIVAGRQLQNGLLAIAVEQTQLYTFRDARIQREVSAIGIGCRTQQTGVTGTNLHQLS